MAVPNSDSPDSAANKDALRALHEQPLTEFQPYGEIEIVSTFGEPQAEYAAIHKSCGLMDLPQRGVLEFTGKDRLAFLNNLISNQTWSKETKSGLAAGQGAYAFLLNVKGRIVADMNVLELGERTLVELDSRAAKGVEEILRHHLFAERVKIVNRSGAIRVLALHGPHALDVLRQIAGDFPNLEPIGAQLCAAETKMFDMGVTVYRDDPTANSGYYLLVPIESAGKLWTALLEKFGGAGQIGRRMPRPIGWAAFNAARIEGGRGMFGIDFDESILPAETGQFERAVSVTKGCYLGQEIVARMYARQQLAKKLVGIRMESDALPIAGSRIYDDNSSEIGGITSSTLSPILSNTAICLGYLKRPFFDPGSVVNIPAEGSMRRGQVTATPFAAPPLKTEN